MRLLGHTPWWARLLATATGLSAIGISGPVGNFTKLSCDWLLGWLCGEQRYPTQFSIDRFFGFALLLGGNVLVAWALGASRGPRGQRHRLVRILFALRWLPLPTGVIAGAIISIARWNPPESIVLVELRNVPKDHASEIVVTDELWPSRIHSRYLESFDILFGFPPGGHGENRQVSVQKHATFRLRSPSVSFERWRLRRSDVYASALTREHLEYVAIHLIPCDDCQAQDHHIAFASLPVCRGYMGKSDGREIRCRNLTLRHPRGGREVRITVDFAGTD
jgi:hypothetical protein